MTKTHNTFGIASSLKDAGLKVIESFSPGIFYVANANTMLTLIITQTLDDKTQLSYQEWLQADTKDFSEWEVSRWLKKY